MAARLAFYVDSGPAEETRRSRATAMRQWIRVFLVLGRPYLTCALVPADDKLSMGATFVAFMAGCGAGVTADTVVGYLSHVRIGHIEHGSAPSSGYGASARPRRAPAGRSSRLCCARC